MYRVFLALSLPSLILFISHSSTIQASDTLLFDHAGPQYTGQYALVDQAVIEQKKYDRMIQNVDKPWPSLQGQAGIANFVLSSYYTNYKTDEADGLIGEFGNLWANHFWSAPVIRAFVDDKINVNMSQSVIDNLTQNCRFTLQNSRVQDARNAQRADGGGSIGGSENHGIKRRSLLYMCAMKLARNPQYANELLPDNQTIAEHAQAWATYWKNHFRNYARHGLETELNSAIYMGYTIGPLLNIYDLTDDATLKVLARQYLDLMFADKAQAYMQKARQLGGARARIYKDKTLLTDGFSEFYAAKFGWIDGEFSNHPKFATSLASDYQVPDVVTDIALNKRGAFQIENDWWGMKGALPSGWSKGYFATANPAYEHQWIRMDGAGRGGVIRHSTVHEDYAMGTAYYSPFMEPNAGTKQNRKMGIIVNSQGNHQLFVNGLGTRQNRQTGYQEITGITGKNASVIWRDNRFFRNIGVRVFATTALYDNGVRNGPWWFSHIANAYVGFRAAQGGWTKTSEHTFDKGTYFILDKPDSPVILEAASKDEYTSFTAFQNAILNNPVTVYSANEVAYTSEAGDRFDVYPQKVKMAKLNGQNVLYRTSTTYNSPYVNGMGVDQDLATITGPSNTRLALDFAYQSFRFEMECATYNNAWIAKYSQRASGGVYLENVSHDGGIDLTFFTPEDGNYKIFANALAADGSSNSVFVKMDDGEKLPWSTLNRPPFQWQSMPGSFNLAKGRHTLTIYPRESGTGIDQIAISEDPALQQKMMPQDCSDIWFTPEASNSASPWQSLSSSDATGGTYLVVPNNGFGGQYRDNKIVSSSTISWPFTVSKPGDYYLQIRNLSPNGKDNSFWVRMNRGDWQVFHLGISAALKWDVLNTSFNLARGTHTLEVALREDGTGLDEVRLSLSKVAPDSR